MSYLQAEQPVCSSQEGAVELLIEAKPRELGGFTVRRTLPSRERRMVGPFIFFDHMGPAEFPPGEGIAVRPHPHIGLATITYLFEGEIMHRDSLGMVQPIRAGAVNLMTAGRGIVHSERAGDDLDTTSRLHGIQSWMALPIEQEECDPAFVHHSAQDLPELVQDGVSVRIVIGKAYGQTSPVSTLSPTLYLDCRMPADSVLALPEHYDELAVYVVAGEVDVDHVALTEGVMAVACAGKRLCVRADIESHVMVIGGTALGRRHIWWNFVSSTKERIEQAKTDWQRGRFDPVPEDTELMPLP